MKSPLLIIFYVCFINISLSQHTKKQYLAQKPPGLKPEIFAPHLVSKDNRSEFGSVFSADGLEFFYAIDEGGKAEIHYSVYEKDEWTAPTAIISHPVYSFNDPFLSVDGQKLFYISDRSIDGSGNKKDYDIWYSNREGDGWSEPINTGSNINTTFNEYYISFAGDGSMYFSSNAQADKGKNHDFDIYKAEWKESEFQKPVKLSDYINTKAYEADVFVAPDESYLIFSAVRKKGLGRGDLYISFKSANGEWSKASNMGPLVNTEGHELCPFVTKDGKYFFFTSNQDIYWVDASLLEAFR